MAGSLTFRDKSEKARESEREISLSYCNDPII
uniref:Uncharacterized protein n=1 Tax=Rhizophora mucronata TaxID=61149 RepID=A0A2P2NQ29_RHIMU